MWRWCAGIAAAAPAAATAPSAAGSAAALKRPARPVTSRRTAAIFMTGGRPPHCAHLKGTWFHVLGQPQKCIHSARDCTTLREQAPHGLHVHCRRVVSVQSPLLSQFAWFVQACRAGHTPVSCMSWLAFAGRRALLHAGARFAIQCCEGCCTAEPASPDLRKAARDNFHRRGLAS